MLVVTIPGDTAPGNYDVRAVKDEFASNPTVISIVPQVTITQAIANRGLTTITGSGFGGYAPGSGTTVTGTSPKPWGGRSPWKPRSFRGVTRESSPVFAESRKR